MQLDKTIEINELLNIYSNMLNEKQLDIMKRYYFYDNSLSEIAEDVKTTRQAVSDLLNRVVKTLYNYENKLQLLSKKNKVFTELNYIHSHTTKDIIKQKVNEIKSILEE